MKKLFIGLSLVLFCQTTAVALAAEAECPGPTASIEDVALEAKTYLQMGLASDVAALATQKQIDNVKAEKEKDPSNEAVQRLFDKATQDKESYELISKAASDLFECNMKQIQILNK